MSPCAARTQCCLHATLSRMKYLPHAVLLAVASLACASVPAAHADTVSDLLAALEGAAPVVQSEIPKSQLPMQEVPAPITLAPVSSVIPMSQADLTQDPRVTALKQQIADLAKVLATLLEAKKKEAMAVTLPENPAAQEVCSLVRTLGRTMSGEDVRALQRFLVGAGMLGSDNATGFFGVATESAVRSWQAANGVVGHGSPETTGYGMVGLQTRAMMQKECGASSASAADVVDPASPSNVNLLSQGGTPKNMRLTLNIQGTSFTRGEKIPVIVTVLDPIPYIGTYIDFMQDTGKGFNTFGNKVFLPVGFSGAVTHYLYSSHMNVKEEDKTVGVSSIPIRADLIGAFRMPEYGDTPISKSLGLSAWQTISISENTSRGLLRFLVNGSDLKGDDFLSGEDFSRFFQPTTTDRATGIETCRVLSAMLRNPAGLTCMWSSEELSSIARNTSKTVPVSTVSHSSKLGSYFMYENDVITIMNTSISRDEALQNCALNHSGNPQLAVRCIWNNEIMYDRGPRGEREMPDDVEPGASPYGAFTTP